MSVILNIALSAPYNDYWGYQDNLLPKYQRKLGHQVIIITTNTNFVFSYPSLYNAGK